MVGLLIICVLVCFGVLLLFLLLFVCVCSLFWLFCFPCICSKSLPRGNQVDGLPRAASFKNFHEKMTFLKSIQDQSVMVPGSPGHEKTSFWIHWKLPEP